MAKLLNTKTNKYDNVPDEQVDELVISGSHGFDPDELVPLRKFGTDEAGEYNGIEAIEKYKSGEWVYDRDFVDNQKIEEFESPLEAAKAVATGVLNAPTFGFGEGALIEAGVIDPEAAKMRDIAYPGTKIASEVVADIVPTVLSGGSYGAGKLALKSATKIAGKKALGKPITRAAVRLGTETAVRSLGDYYSETARENVEFDGEAAVSRALTGGTIGALFGAGAGKLSQKLAQRSTGKLINKAVDTLEEIDDRSAIDGLKLWETLKPGKDESLGKGIRLLDDVEGWRYSDGKIDAYIDPGMINTSILDLNDSRLINEIGESYGIFDLHDIAFPKGLTVGETLKDAGTDAVSYLKKVIGDQVKKDVFADELLRLEKKQGTDIAKDKVLSGLRRLQNEKTDLMDEIRAKGYNPVLKRKLDNVIKKRNELLKGLKRSKAQTDEIAKKLDRDGIDLDQFGVIKNRNLSIVKNSEFLDGAIKKVAKSSGEIVENIPLRNSDKYILSALKVPKRARKILGTQKLSEMAELVRGLADGRPITKGFIKNLSPDSLGPRIEQKINETGELLEAVFGAVDNAALNRGTKIKEFKASRLKKDILGAIDEELIDFDTKAIKNSAVYDKAKEAVEKVFADIADKDGFFDADRILSAQEVRILRQNFDNMINFNVLPENMPLFQNILNNARWRINDRLVDAMERMKIAPKLVDTFKKSNREMHLLLNARDFVKGAIADDQIIKGQMIDNVNAATGVLIGSTINPAYAVAAGVLGSFKRKIMDEFQYEVGEGVARALEKINIDGQASIAKAAIGYVKNFASATSKGVNASIIISKIPANSYSIYKQDVDDLNELTEDFNAQVEAFSKGNAEIMEYEPAVSQAMLETTSRAIALLNEFIPRSPYGEDSDEEWIPPQSEMSRYHRLRNAILKPKTVLDMAKAGYISPEGKLAMQRIYPQMWSKFVADINTTLQKAKISQGTKRAINRQLGVGVNLSTDPRGMLMLQNIRNPQEVQQQYGNGVPRKADLNAQREMTTGQRLMDR